MRDKKLYIRQFMNPELDTKEELRYKLTMDSIVPGVSAILQVPEDSKVSIDGMHFTDNIIDKIEIYKWIDRDSEERFIVRVHIGNLDIARCHFKSDLYVTFDRYGDLSILELDSRYIEWYNPEQLELADTLKELTDEVRVV